MSAATQTNGKKSSNSSAINTPASTPVTNGNSQMISQSTPPPPSNNAPKYGTLVPNRIFVGGISANTTEGELLQLFSTYGTVKAAKIIQDRAGVSKGYGFITFDSEEDAKRPLKDADNIVLRERKLNIAPAIKKQPFNRAFDASSPSTVAPGNTAQYFFPPSAGVPYFQGGVTYYQQPPTAPGDPNTQPTTVYQDYSPWWKTYVERKANMEAPPVYPTQTGPPQAPTYSPIMFPHHIYMPQQYAMPPMPYDYNYYPTNNGAPQYMVGTGQNGPSSNSGGGGGTSSQQPPPQAVPMPSSNSPPRPPPCYNSQLPPYAPEPIFYNMPAMYGTAMDGGPPIYPDTLEMPNGVLPPPLPPHYPTEVSQIIGEYFPPAGACYDATEMIEHMSLEHQQQHHHDNNDIDSGRQSKTPVVSLLSMEQHQEKDFVAMQGGRRVKLQPPPPPPPPPPHQQPPYCQNFSMRPQMQMAPLSYKSANHNNSTWRKPRVTPTVNRADSSSRSSLRTDSNSSANAAVDENKNEDANANNSVNTFVAHNFQGYNGGSRTYQNSLTRRPNSNNNNRKDCWENNNKIKGSNFVVQSTQVRPNFVLGPPPPSGTGTSSQVAGVRRNKRTTRRSGQSGGGLSEIGAGDAPLPSDVSDACKKLETLKM